MNEIQLHTLLDQARRFLEEGKALHALQIYTRLVEVAPGLEEPYVRLSQLYADMGRGDRAEQILRAGSVRDPHNIVFVTVLGDFYLRSGRYEDAIACLRQIADRRLPAVHFTVGLAAMHLQRWTEAEREFRTAIMLDGRWPRAYEALGEVLIQRKQYAEAIRELEHGLRVEPYSGVGNRLAGIARLNRLEFPKALEHLTLAVDIDPDDAEAWHLCGDVLLRMRRFEEAEPYLQRALKLNPRSADTSVSIGYLCLHRGDTRRALDAFNRALELQPGHPRAVDGKLHLRIQRKRVL